MTHATRHHHLRALRIANSEVRRHNLRLHGLTVYTEAATGAYSYTACLAALAGADVVAVGGASRFGDAQAAIAATRDAARAWGVSDRISFSHTRCADDLARADILTNSGHVRPIDAPFVDRLKPTAVIPLMWETFEWRPEEVDLAACHARGILVMGTDERKLDFFPFAAEAVIKLCHTHAVALHGSHILGLGSGVIMDATLLGLRRAGAQTRQCAWDMPARRGKVLAHGSKALWAFAAQCDIILCDERQDTRPLLGGTTALMDASLLARRNPTCLIINRHGVVEQDIINSLGMECVPSTQTCSWQTPHFTTAILGIRPVLTLMTAGLKVGECMACARHAGHSPQQTAQYAAAHSAAQDFAPPYNWIPRQEGPHARQI